MDIDIALSNAIALDKLYTRVSVQVNRRYPNMARTSTPHPHPKSSHLPNVLVLIHVYSIVEEMLLPYVIYLFPHTPDNG